MLLNTQCVKQTVIVYSQWYTLHMQSVANNQSQYYDICITPLDNRQYIVCDTCNTAQCGKQPVTAMWYI